MSNPLSPASHVSLSTHDPELHDLIEREKWRQRSGLELIASENITSQPVLECLGSVLTNKYSEGLPGARYYGGNQFIDEIESLCIKRALEAFSLSPDEWGVNVQPYSGSSANFEAYTAILKPHDRIMGLDLPSGGHLTHGYYTAKKKISATSVYFESLPYRLDPSTGLIDYAALAETARVFRPRAIIAGGSAYPREWEYAKLREIADENSALLLVDMAHISGLVATGCADSPFNYADVVTSTTHKSLRGPRSGLIFWNKRRLAEKAPEADVNFAVFPMLQGGPHEHQIAALATQLKEVVSPEFKSYIQQVCINARRLGEELIQRGYNLISGGTDNHLLLWDLRPKGISGSKLEKLFDKVHITVNKNAVVGDKSALVPGGVRLGSPALTSRGLREDDMATVAEFLHRGVEIALECQSLSLSPKIVDFMQQVNGHPKIAALRDEVKKFACQFDIPGIDVNTMKYRDSDPPGEH